MPSVLIILATIVYFYSRYIYIITVDKVLALLENVKLRHAALQAGVAAAILKGSPSDTNAEINTDTCLYFVLFVDAAWITINGDIFHNHDRKSKYCPELNTERQRDPLKMANKRSSFWELYAAWRQLHILYSKHKKSYRGWKRLSLWPPLFHLILPFSHNFFTQIFSLLNSSLQETFKLLISIHMPLLLNVHFLCT